MSDEQNSIPESQAQPVKSDSSEQRSEKSYKAVAHNPRVSHEARVNAAEKLSELHKERTGEELDPQHEASIGDKKAELRE
ncbi:3617_t:CDS:2 [Entrophospora sp. SA101]|nr:9595_t:CDS:2 [Entrophospora sp. SA101]CAJ0633227.1 14705_t:CDS:2 [Entrophospora sp. SA101]CAJ0757568.1 19099_t:CDS:2 [Entrophospora sp. SA101]CAJ0760614.1 3617_t:CDS:2 [Entrophospora sp. SA101]CAJ0882782.1 8925_t:CDS:2 [Entrophospora sp. SA101]